MTLMIIASYLSSITIVSKYIQIQDTRATIWYFEIRFRHTNINSRSKPMMILSGVFRSQ